MKAKFKIHDTFRITNRGIVLLGEIVEGLIQIGDCISFTVNETPWHKKIIGLDAGMRRPAGKPNTGLLLSYQDEEELNLLLNWKPNLQIGIINETVPK